MASVYYLFDDAKDIADYIIWSTEDKYDLDKKRYFAALVIQRTFRGFAVRCHYKNMVKAATVIQKNVRGHLARIHMGETAAVAFQRKCEATFHKLATKIQALWKGYWIRKNINIQTIITEMKEEQETQEAISRYFSKIFKERELDNSEPSLSAEGMEDQEKLIYKINKKSPEIVKALFDKHHLLRTHQIEGVLSIHGSQELSLLETFLKKLECKKYIRAVRKLYKEELTPELEYMFKDRRARRIEDLIREKYIREGKEKLESINRKMPKSIHRKPFVISKKIGEKKYQKSLMAGEEYTGYRSALFRVEKKESRRFNLDVMHVDLGLKKEPPYFIDHWKKVCSNHNII